MNAQKKYMAEQIKKSPIPMWAVIAASIIITLLFIKFCTNNKSEKIDVKPVKQTHADDSVRMVEEAKKYKQQADENLRRAQEAEQKYEKASSSLASMVEENKRLLNNRKPVVAVQTGDGITTVPQEFIDDCEGCFTQLAKTNDSAIAYQQEAQALRAVMEAQNTADSQRIVQLEADKLRLNKSYNDMRIAAEVNAKYLEPRRKVKTGLIGTFGSSFLPTGVGVGLMYEDKKDRNFGLEATFGNRPPAYEAFMYVPFTLRNK